MTYPIAAPRTTLRKDPRGHQIEDDQVAERTLGALELVGLIFAEMAFHRISLAGLNPTDPDTDLALRALGTVSGRVAMSRLAWLTGVDEAGRARADRAADPEAEAVGLRIRAVLHWLLEWDPTEVDAPPRLRQPSTPPPSVRLALSELWASLLYFDRRASEQGISGPGRRRTITRETTRKRAT